MSTTDYAPQYNQYPQPFHIYLKKPERLRPRDCWSVYCDDVQLFDSIDDALVHGAAVLGDERFDVVPVIDLDLPTYWEVRANNDRNRVIGTKIVKEIKNSCTAARGRSDRAAQMSWQRRRPNAPTNATRSRCSPVLVARATSVSL